MQEQAGSHMTDREDGMLKWVFGVDGSIAVIEKTLAVDGEAIQLKARTTYCMKVDLDAYKPPKPDNTPLPNGYAVFVASRSEMLLQDDTEDLIVGPNVAELGSDGDLIFGKVVLRSGDKRMSDEAGYFVLNSGEGDRNLIKGLTAEQWINTLQTRGLKRPPELISSDRKRPRGDWSED